MGTTLLSNIRRRVITAFLAVAALVVGLMVAAPAANAEVPPGELVVTYDGLTVNVVSSFDSPTWFTVTNFTTDAWAERVELPARGTGSSTVPTSGHEYVIAGYVYLESGTSALVFSSGDPVKLTENVTDPENPTDPPSPTLPGPPNGMPEQANRPEWAGPPAHAAEPGRPDTNPGKGKGKGRNKP